MMRLLVKSLAAGYAMTAACFALDAPATIVPSNQAAPKSITATYKVYKAGIWIGTVEEHFSRDGDTYKIVSDTETAGPLRLLLREKVTLSSEGSVGVEGLKPSTYAFTRRNEQKRNIFAIFDWQSHQIVSRHTGESEVFDLPEGTQDRISAMYQFMFSVPRTLDVNVWMSQGKKAELYHYRKQGEPMLTMNGERIPTVYYARDVKAGESKAHLWLATTKYHLPVKIIFEDKNGSSLEQVLVGLQIE
ncbi:MAG: DUF3108 domain-containing protein [Burkholderiales bacterium]|nr:DUF3108 domain-containing protein [Burkholderiales bacterium]